MTIQIVVVVVAQLKMRSNHQVVLILMQQKIDIKRIQVVLVTTWYHRQIMIMTLKQK